jgi:hypothetical protein
MMLLERLEEIDDGRWPIEMCDCLLRFYENGTRWPHGTWRNDVTMPYTKRFDKQLATHRRVHHSPTVSMAAIMLNGFCEDASGQDWPWEDVKPRLDEAAKRDGTAYSGATKAIAWQTTT